MDLDKERARQVLEKMETEITKNLMPLLFEEPKNTCTWEAAEALIAPYLYSLIEQMKIERFDICPNGFPFSAWEHETLESGLEIRSRECEGRASSGWSCHTEIEQLHLSSAEHLVVNFQIPGEKK